MSEFKAMWLNLFGKTHIKVTEPVLSRWWTIGQAIKQVLPNLDKWAIIAQKCVDAYPVLDRHNKCGSAITSMLAEPAIIAHLHWMNAFHECWWN